MVEIMKIFRLLLILLLPLQFLFAQELKPYILGFESTDSISTIKTVLQNNLGQNNMTVIGQYQPAGDEKRWVIIFSSAELQNAVLEVGGLSGFAAAMRVAITAENDKVIVSYTNPDYWGNAYFQDAFEKVSENYSNLKINIENAIKASGEFIGTPFGSEDGIDAEDLQEYHYMFGMPYFEDTIVLKEFVDYQAALNKVEASIENGVPNLEMVYKVNIPGKDLTLYGFGLSGENGESNFLPTIDISSPKHTAFLPYEILVAGNEVHMLHGRFRIALSFPDLTMMTFTKIMSTPGDIEELLSQLVN